MGSIVSKPPAPSSATPQRNGEPVPPSASHWTSRRADSWVGGHFGAPASALAPPTCPHGRCAESGARLSPFGLELGCTREQLTQPSTVRQVAKVDTGLLCSGVSDTSGTDACRDPQLGATGKGGPPQALLWSHVAQGGHSEYATP